MEELCSEESTTVECLHRVKYIYDILQSYDIEVPSVIQKATMKCLDAVEVMKPLLGEESINSVNSFLLPRSIYFVEIFAHSLVSLQQTVRQQSSSNED